MHPIMQLQTALVAALGADAELTALIGADGVFDAPPRGRAAPYVVIDRHELRPRDGDLAPGFEHRVMFHCWSDRPSRKGALAIAGRVAAVSAGVAPAGLAVTLVQTMRTDTVIDAQTGQARAAVLIRFLSE